MNPPDLPALPTIGQPPEPPAPNRFPITTANNPGCVNVCEQQSRPPQVNQCASSSSSASAINSTGEFQIGNQLLGNTIQGTVMKSAASVPTVHLSGEGGQRPDHRAADQAQITGRGLAADVFAGSVSHVHSEAPKVVPCTSPAVTVNAGTAHSGGLPMNVHIR